MNIVLIIIVAISFLAGLFSKKIKLAMALLILLLALVFFLKIDAILYFSIAYIVGVAISTKFLRPKFNPKKKQFFLVEKLRDLVQLAILLLSSLVYLFFGRYVFFSLSLVVIILFYLAYMLKIKQIFFLSREVPDMGALYLGIGSLLLASFFSPIEFIALAIFYKGGDAFSSLYRSYKKKRELFVPALIMLSIGFIIMFLIHDPFLLFAIILGTFAEAQPLLDDNIMIPIGIIIGEWITKYFLLVIL